VVGSDRNVLGDLPQVLVEFGLVVVGALVEEVLRRDRVPVVAVIGLHQEEECGG